MNSWNSFWYQLARWLANRTWGSSTRCCCRLSRSRMGISRRVSRWIVNHFLYVIKTSTSLCWRNYSKRMLNSSLHNRLGLSTWRISPFSNHNSSSNSWWPWGSSGVRRRRMSLLSSFSPSRKRKFTGRRLLRNLLNGEWVLVRGLTLT